MKKAVLKYFATFAGKLKACNFIKIRQVLFSKYCEIFKNTCFEERPLTYASDFLKQLQNIGEINY